jgi:hypothetical protein
MKNNKTVFHKFVDIVKKLKLLIAKYEGDFKTKVTNRFIFNYYEIIRDL